MASDFSAKIKKFSDKSKLSVRTIMRKVALDAYTGVVRKSPVDTGRFRGNWNVALAVPDTSTNDKKPHPKRKPGERVPKRPRQDGDGWARAIAALAGAKPGITIFITNNLPYAVYLENGSSRQAPAGMLGITVEEVKRSIPNIVIQARIQYGV